LQVSEIAFLVLFGFWSIAVFRGNISIGKPGWIGWAILAYLLSNVLSTLFNFNSTTFLDLIGRTYLVLVFFVLKSIFEQSQFSTKGFKILPWILALSVIPALFGYTLAHLEGKANFLVWFYPDYPYFGDTFRTKGLMQSPNLLFNLLVCLFFLSLIYHKSFNKWLKGSAFLTAVFTFAKSWLFFGVSLIWYLSNQTKGWIRITFRLFAFLLFLVAAVGTYVLIKNGDQCFLSENIPTHRDSSAFYQQDGFCFIRTSYAVLHSTEIRAGVDYLPLGSGPGNFINQVPELKEKGWYPQHMEPFEAHSTLFGTFFELGIPGLASLLLLVYAIGQQLKLIPREQNLIFTALFLFLAQEAIFNDINNFRHIWVILAYFAALDHHKS
ncbi:MAG: hypothetical protein KDC24_07915, partial [Saprospiraceae bacterium]|nr:hypothetical protein [Saprospiraceae bacterium]